MVQARQGALGMGLFLHGRRFGRDTPSAAERVTVFSQDAANAAPGDAYAFFLGSIRFCVGLCRNTRYDRY